MRRTAFTLLLATLASAAAAQESPSLVPVGLTLRWRSDQGPIEIPADRPDRHAPIGVLGDHPQDEGTWMFSYRYLRADFEGLVDGQEEISEGEVFNDGYGDVSGSSVEQVPTKLVRETHRFGALYGYDDQLSFLLTIPWVSNQMDLVSDAGESFESRATGMGDLVVTGLYSLRREPDEHFHLNLGVSLPTGSTDEKDKTPKSAGEPATLSYPLQLGSGTIDLHPGLTYFRLREETSWGAQATQTVRLGENSDGYTLGNETRFTTWVARQFQEDLSGSLRLAYLHEGRIDGADDRLDRSFDPAADPDAQGGDRLDVYAGVNYTRPGGHRFAAEIGGPIFQDLNGPQLEGDLVYAFGWQFSF